MTWVREGYCCKCGDCCRGSVPGEDAPAQTDGACPYLMAERGGERLCKIHDTVNTYWSRGCNVWPSDPIHIVNIARCTFRFRWES
jgi:hypothetical protein